MKMNIFVLAILGFIGNTSAQLMGDSEETGQILFMGRVIDPTK